MAITRQIDIPNTGTKGDRWVDTYDSSKIYLVHTTYDVSATNATLSLASSLRPGTVALTFTSVVTGYAGRYIQIVIIDKGASGTSALSKTGSGTRSDQYVYTFNTYQDDNSNNSIIALLAGDTDLVATGSDPTNGDVVDVNGTLDNGVMDNLYGHSLVMRYHASPAEFTATTDAIPSYVPANVRALLAEGVAARLALMHDGLRNLNRAQFWDARFNKTVMDARENRWRAMYPNGARR